MISSEGGPAAAGPLFLRFKGLLERVDQVSYGMTVFAMAGMALLVSAQVVARYAFSASIDWADEVARLFFVWAMFMAIPHGIKYGVHVGIDIIVLHFRKRLRDAVFKVMAGLSGFLMGLVFYYSILVVGDKWQELMPTLNVTAAVYYIPVLIATGHSFLHLALLSWGGPNIWQGRSP
ncbi:MAG TPA: TRAP transporter small permease subunit [Rhodospirillales bacterium]|nr:TRAP transporter small permease subunit [Rhodospirillales bacterium]